MCAHVISSDNKTDKKERKKMAEEAPAKEKHFHVPKKKFSLV
jgi:hypothetical protein